MLRRVFEKIMEENQTEPIVKDIMEDEEVKEEFLPIIEANGMEFLKSNFELLLQLSLLQWSEILETEEEDLEEVKRIDDQIEEYIESNQDEIDVLEMKAVMEE